MALGIIVWNSILPQVVSLYHRCGKQYGFANLRFGHVYHLVGCLSIVPLFHWLILLHVIVSTVLFYPQTLYSWNISFNLLILLVSNHILNINSNYLILNLWSYRKFGYTNCAISILGNFICTCVNFQFMWIKFSKHLYSFFMYFCLHVCLCIL